MIEIVEQQINRDLIGAKGAGRVVAPLAVAVEVRLRIEVSDRIVRNAVGADGERVRRRLDVDCERPADVA